VFDGGGRAVTLTFANFIGARAPLKLPGAPFLLASVLLLLTFAIAVRTLAKARGAVEVRRA